MYIREATETFVVFLNKVRERDRHYIMNPLSILKLHAVKFNCTFRGNLESECSIFWNILVNSIL